MFSGNLFKTENKFTCVKPKKARVKIPKSINIYFILCLFIFGLDFGFKNTLNKYIRMVFTSIQLCVSIMMCVILNWRIFIFKFDSLQASIHTIQYLMHCAVLLFSKYNVYDLIIDVHNLDKNIMRTVNMQLAFVLYVSTILIFGLKQTLCVINCIIKSSVYCETPFPGYWYCIPLIAIDEVTIVQMLLYYYVYRSVKYVRIILIHFDIKTVQERYFAVVKFCDKIRHLNSAFVSFLLFFVNQKYLEILLNAKYFTNFVMTNSKCIIFFKKKL